MMLRFGSIFANDIVSICTVVPVTCGPWRAEIAKELLGLLIPSQSEGIDTALSACLKRTLVDPRANYESVFSRVLDAGRTGISPFAGYLAPPTAVCYSCQGALQKNNRPVIVTCVYSCILVYTHVYLCILVSTCVYSCIFVYTLYTHVYLCIPCIPVYTCVYSCIPVYTRVYL